MKNQDVVPINSYDTAGSFLILGCNNGSIYYIGKVNKYLMYYVLVYKVANKKVTLVFNSCIMVAK